MAAFEATEVLCFLEKVDVGLESAGARRFAAVEDLPTGMEGGTDFAAALKIGASLDGVDTVAADAEASPAAAGAPVAVLVALVPSASRHDASRWSLIVRVGTFREQMGLENASEEARRGRGRMNVQMRSRERAGVPCNCHIGGVGTGRERRAERTVLTRIRGVGFVVSGHRIMC
jgi:hypothetical protein